MFLSTFATKCQWLKYGWNKKCVFFFKVSCYGILKFSKTFTAPSACPILVMVKGCTLIWVRDAFSDDSWLCYASGGWLTASLTDWSGQVASATNFPSKKLFVQGSLEAQSLCVLTVRQWSKWTGLTLCSLNAVQLFAGERWCEWEPNVQFLKRWPSAGPGM